MKTITIIILAVVSIYVYLAFRDYNPDDAFITYRYVQNILKGDGWVYNSGECVNASTSPLHTILLAALYSLSLPIPVSAKILGVLSLFIASLFTILTLEITDNKNSSVVVPFLLVTSPWVLVSLGLEIMLSLCFASLAIYFYMRFWNRHETTCYLYASCAFLALLTLTRFDGVILVFSLFIDYVFRKKKIPFKGIALYLAILSPWLFFSTMVFGSPFPSTLQAKMAQGASDNWLTYISGFKKDILSFLRQNPSYYSWVVFLSIGTVSLFSTNRKYLF